jgi:O-antigen/teichoic acid export membrane protein
VLEVLFAIIASLTLNITIKRTYPYLDGSELSGKELMDKHPTVWIKTKQLFFHKLGGIILTRLSPIVIYGVATLELVAIYGNYMLIISGVTSLIIAIFNSMNAGVGNLVARGDKDRILKVFDELFSIRFLITTVICFTSYAMTQPFMKIWMGPDLLLDNECLILFVAIMFINLNRLTPDAFINAYGLFNDIWSPIVESIINLTLSVLLGTIWGIKGVLLGVLISLFLVIFCWKQYFLFRRGFKEDIFKCIALYIKHISIAAVAYFIISPIYNSIFIFQVNGLLSWGVSALAYASISAMVMGLLLLICTSGMKSFAKRMINILKA